MIGHRTAIKTHVNLNRYETYKFSTKCKTCRVQLIFCRIVMLHKMRIHRLNAKAHQADMKNVTWEMLNNSRLFKIRSIWNTFRPQEGEAAAAARGVGQVSRCDVLNLVKFDVFVKFILWIFFHWRSETIRWLASTFQLQILCKTNWSFAQPS